MTGAHLPSKVALCNLQCFHRWPNKVTYRFQIICPILTCYTENKLFIGHEFLELAIINETFMYKSQSKNKCAGCLRSVSRRRVVSAEVLTCWVGERQGSSKKCSEGQLKIVREGT